MYIVNLGLWSCLSSSSQLVMDWNWSHSRHCLSYSFYRVDTHFGHLSLINSLLQSPFPDSFQKSPIMRYIFSHSSWYMYFIHTYSTAFPFPWISPFNPFFYVNRYWGFFDFVHILLFWCSDSEAFSHVLLTTTTSIYCIYTALHQTCSSPFQPFPSLYIWGSGFIRFCIFLWPLRRVGLFWVQESKAAIFFESDLPLDCGFWSLGLSSWVGIESCNELVGCLLLAPIIQRSYLFGTWFASWLLVLSLVKSSWVNSNFLEGWIM